MIMYCVQPDHGERWSIESMKSETEEHDTYASFAEKKMLL